MLEQLNPEFRLVDQKPPSPRALLSLREARAISEDLAELYGEVGEIDVEGPEPRYFRIWTANEILEIDDAYGVSRAIPGAVPIGSDGGGKLIVMRGEALFSVGYGALAESSLRPLAASLGSFLKNPEPLWPWIEKSPT